MLKLEENKNYLLGLDIINEAQIRTMSRKDAKIGDTCSVIIDERISRDLWGKSGVIAAVRTDNRVVVTNVRWRSYAHENVQLYFLKFNDEDFRMSGVWLELEQLF